MCLHSLLAAWTRDAVVQDGVGPSREGCAEAATLRIPVFSPAFSPPQRALLEQKQRRKRQEPLMVQPNTEARPRRARTRRGEEQAPLVESQLGVTNDVIMDGEDVSPGTAQFGVLKHAAILKTC